MLNPSQSVPHIQNKPTLISRKGCSQSVCGNKKRSYLKDWYLRRNTFSLSKFSLCIYWGNVKDEWWSFPWIFYFDFMRWPINHFESMFYYFTYIIEMIQKLCTNYFVKLQRVCTFAYELIVGNEYENHFPNASCNLFYLPCKLKESNYLLFRQFSWNGNGGNPIQG